ncbi:MAG: Lysine-specific demethylase 4B [Chaenotheca gracillima]|nr:MAG: Lysine-specific demethylase 4B [Chaenotheca gracillima]
MTGSKSKALQNSGHKSKMPYVFIVIGQGPSRLRTLARRAREKFVRCLSRSATLTANIDDPGILEENRNIVSPHSDGPPPPYEEYCGDPAGKSLSTNEVELVDGGSEATSR